MDDSLPNRARGIAAYYDRLASVYGEEEVFGARRAAVLSAIATEFAGAHAVLDLGCGNGTYAAEITTQAPAVRVFGVDLSAEMLRAARQRVRAPIPFAQADATALPFRAAYFDLVFMSHVLQLVSDIERCVSEIAACLAPDGLWISTVGVSGWREAIGELLDAETLQELVALMASARVRAAIDDRTRVAEACARVGLQPTWRSAPFSVGWDAFEEWLRIRWFTVIDEPARAGAERWLDQVRSRAAGHMFSVTETLLVARKQRANPASMSMS